MISTLRAASPAAEAANRQSKADRSRRSVNTGRASSSSVLVSFDRFRPSNLDRSRFFGKLKPRLQEALCNRRSHLTAEPAVLHHYGNGDLGIVCGCKGDEPGVVALIASLRATVL